MPQTLKIKRKYMVVVKHVLKMISYNNMSSYNSINKTALTISKHAIN
jgi:hypothetical protein